MGSIESRMAEFEKMSVASKPSLRWNSYRGIKSESCREKSNKEKRNNSLIRTTEQVLDEDVISLNEAKNLEEDPGVGREIDRKEREEEDERVEIHERPSDSIEDCYMRERLTSSTE